MYYTIFAKREENFLAKIDVAPLAGARIEINAVTLCSRFATVAPLAGARIEINKMAVLLLSHRGRSPRGSAD